MESQQITKSEEITSTNTLENNKTEIATSVDQTNSTTTSTTTTTKVLSKNQQKKLIRSEKWAKQKAEKKDELKQRQKDNKKKRKEMMTPEDINKLAEINKKKKRDPSHLQYSGTVLIDLEECDKMAEREQKSLVTQVQFLYGTNRLAEKPFHIELSGFQSQIKDKFERMVGFENWTGIDRYSQSYFDKYSKDRLQDLVYLSSDSPNVITTLDPSKIYIIGGLVDHNRLKGLTYNKATTQGIYTAKLPISEFIQLQSRKVLAVNHVFDILSHYTECNDWKKAFETVIPLRKFNESAKQSATNKLDNNNNNNGEDYNNEYEEEEHKTKKLKLDNDKIQSPLNVNCNNNNNNNDDDE
ncbi:putative RNaseIII [Tieghemostelium lacteum]|uniref:tRNA (guanine(9)-N(1))-methyltransferase n=1 Tax=Tieghemostelium lacteum TaxID=361077 RepID=A0A152A2F6_TIELA|nr:putative RNaseIII [Tieghemostelium lacteum]|eukprot:KYR00297.1 putative RNaseIII [Tieghemostelium lacteum]